MLVKYDSLKADLKVVYGQLKSQLDKVRSEYIDFIRTDEDNKVRIYKPYIDEFESITSFIEKYMDLEWDEEGETIMGIIAYSSSMKSALEEVDGMDYRELYFKSYNHELLLEKNYDWKEEWN